MRAHQQRIWHTWTRMEAQQSHMLAADRVRERKYREDPLSGYCSVCCFADKDLLILEMHWILAHSAAPTHRHLLQLPRARAVEEIEQIVVTGWTEVPPCTEPALRNAWMRAMQCQATYDEDAALALSHCTKA